MAPRKNDSCSWKKGAKDSLWLLKKPDSEPLLRYDLQLAVLDELFNDRTFKFTAPVDSNNPPAEPIYLNFDQLYLEALLSSTKMAPHLRKKLIENSTFAASFCKLSFLINVGRLNTTVAFGHTMKTVLRTYHPVPSLQKDEVCRTELQDALRLRQYLRGAMLDWEAKTKPPTKLEAIAKAATQIERGPPTTIVNLLFVMFNEAIWVTKKYMPEGFDVMDLLYPSTLPSKPRAQAFLTIVHHMYEDKAFIDDFETDGHIDLHPPVAVYREVADPPENIDSPDELEWVQQVRNIREEMKKHEPAMQKRDEEVQSKAAAKLAKRATAAVASATTVPPNTDSAPEIVAVGKRKGGAHQSRKGKAPRSFARVTLEESKKTARPVDILPEGWRDEDWSEDVAQPKSSLSFVWRQVERDMNNNRDPNYDSEEDGVWPWDLLRQRKLVTVQNRQTGERVSVTDLPEYETWLQKKRDGSEQAEAATATGTPAPKLAADDDNYMDE
ncbi:hypothetical protein ACM66B_002853 [Microbotryomycetes sp. NB124-2]